MGIEGLIHLGGYIALAVLLVIVSGYVVYCCVAFVTLREVLFPRSAIEVPLQDPQDIPGVERMWIPTAHGRVEAWFLSPEPIPDDGPAPAVIFAHGNAELIDFWPEILQPFRPLGVGVLLVEYPGYGRSEGSPSQASITEAFTAAYDVLVAREDVDASRIILFGRSLGGGAVSALAAERPSAALILMSSFTSVRAFTSRYRFPGFLIRDPFDSLSVVRSYRQPVLVIHGTRDSVVPYDQGVALYQAAPRGAMISYSMGHNDGPPSWDQFWEDMERFLNEAGIIHTHAEAALPSTFPEDGAEARKDLPNAR